MRSVKVYILTFLTGVLVLLTSAPGYCFSVRDSLLMRYKNVKTSYNEKVRLLLNIYDLSVSDPARQEVARELFRISLIAKDEHHQLEAISYMENRFNDQSKMVPLLKYCGQLKPTNQQREVYQYLRYNVAVQGINRNDEVASSKMLHSLIKEYATRKKGDIYFRVGDLLILCKFLSQSATGKLYTEYITILGELVDKLPNDGRSLLPDTYYDLAVTFYFNQNMLKKAYAINNERVTYAEERQAEYKKEGREYVSYVDVRRYIHYRRELTMADILSRKQIEEIYAKINELSKTSKEVYYDLNAPSSMAKINYYMAIKDYAKAIPYLDYALDNDADSLRWMRADCLKYRIMAGDAVKDPNMDKYLIMYISKLEQEISGNIEGMTKELQTMYDVNDIRQKSAVKRLYVSIIVFVFLIITFFIVLYLLKSSRRMESSLKTSGIQLEQEKKNLSVAMKRLVITKEQAEKDNNLKTLFINNISKDIETPLNAVDSFVKLLINERDMLTDSEASAYANLININGKGIIKIVKDALGEKGYEIRP